MLLCGVNFIQKNVGAFDKKDRGPWFGGGNGIMCLAGASNQWCLYDCVTGFISSTLVVFASQNPPSTNSFHCDYHNW